MRVTALFVDFDGIDEALRVACLPVAPAVLAQSLRRSARLLTGGLVGYVCGAWKGGDHGAAEAFQGEGFTILESDGSAEAKRAAFDRQIDELEAGENPPEVYVLVTHDPALGVVVERILAARRDVRVWGLACSAPEELRAEAFQFYSLEDLLDLRVRSHALFIDFENVAFCLHDLGYTVDPAVLARHFRERAAQGGGVLHAFAYADWHRLPPMQDATGRSLSSEAQRVFELHNIETRYLISRAGKNTADMKIADDIRTLLHEPNSPDTFIIASGDRDFTPVVDTLLRQGKEVIVWGVRGKTSRSLAEAAHVEYLQEFVPLASSPPQPSDTTAAPTEGVNGLVGDTAPSIWTPLIVMLDETMSRNNWSWVSFSKLVSEANRSGKFGASEEDTRDLINQAIARGVILRERIPNPNPNYPDQFIWACRPNDASPVVQAARIIPPVTTEIMWRSIVERGWDYVAFSFLLREMANSSEIAQVNAAGDDDWRAAWINFLVSEGKLRLERRPHPKNRRDMMKALTLPEQDVLMRIIVSIDNFCATRSTTWEAASALLQYLACFGVDAVRSALAAGEKYGAFRMAKYPHPADQDRPPTTGISLNREVPFVARVLERRNTLLRALYAAHERCAGTWEQDIAAITGEKAALWRSILTHERLIRPAESGANNGNRYVLSRSHVVVRAACGLPPAEASESAQEGPEPVGPFSPLAHTVAVEDVPARHPDGNGRKKMEPAIDWSTVGPGVFD